MDITCRHAKPEDLEEAEPRRQQSECVACRNGLQHWPARNQLDRLSEILHGARSSGLRVAEDGETIVGLA